MANENPFRRSILDSKLVLEPHHLRRLDQVFSEGLDGTGGGTYTPVAPIVLGGKGVVLNGSGGGLTGLTVEKFAPPGALRLGLDGVNGTWPEFTSTRSYTRIFPIRQMVRGVNLTRLTAGQMQIISTISPLSRLLVCPLQGQYLPRGAAITSISLKMRVGIEPSALPAAIDRPRFIIGGLPNKPTNGATIGVPIAKINTWLASTSYTTTSSSGIYATVLPSPDRPVFFVKETDGTHSSGGSQPVQFASANPGDSVVDGAVTWICRSKTDVTYIYATQALQTRFPIPSTTNGYFQNGTIRTITLSAPNVNHIIDTDTYTYALFIDDLSGTKNIYHSLKIVFGSTSSMKPGI